MGVDIVCDESELSMAINKMEDYAYFLQTIMEEYRTILSNIQNDGINDIKIDAKLLALKAAILPYEMKVVPECRRTTSNMKKYINDVAEADKFVFPESIMSSVRAIISQFK